MEKIFELLEQHNISRENIERHFSKMFLISYSEMEKIFGVIKSDTQINKDYTFSDIKKYILFSENYNRYYTLEELDNLCGKLGISKELFITEVFGIDNYFVDYYKQTLKTKGYIWVGESVSLTKEQMEENKFFIIGFVKNISSYFCSRGHFDRDDVYDFTLDVTINKCGDIFTNIIDEELRSKCLFNKVICYLRVNFLKKDSINVENILNNKKFGVKDEYYVTINYDFLTKEENYMLNVLSTNIENDVPNFFQKSADALDMPLDVFNDSLEKVKTKIKTHKFNR